VPQYGFTAMAEQSTPRQMIDGAVDAERAGFDFLMVSDHFHPWLESQGQSPFTWSVLGAIAERTEQIDLITAVTCPFIRYHPAIIAQAAATVGILSEGRFTLGVGAGENLNEHVVARGWPAVDVRHEMLAESVAMIRALWSGGKHTIRGRHLEVENARLYSLPSEPLNIVMAAGGPQAAALAGRLGDGLMAVEPDERIVDEFRKEGGDHKPIYGQLAVCWAEDGASARRTARERWRFALSGWKVQSELPSTANFEAESRAATEEDVAAVVVCGPDPDVLVEALRTWEKAGFTHIGVVQAGDDQKGFLRFWEQSVAPRLAAQQRSDAARAVLAGQSI
jgi:G6PDH family F420-dependent oxidoreductase